MKKSHFLHFVGAWVLYEILAAGLAQVDAPSVIAMWSACLLTPLARVAILENRGKTAYVFVIPTVAGATFGWITPYSGWLLLGLWAFLMLYIFAMGVYRAHLSGRLHGPILWACMPIIAIAMVVDFLFQVTVFTLVFWELPAELMLTERLQRHMLDTGGWRKELAVWMCANLLDPFDPRGTHCGIWINQDEQNA